MSTKSPTPETTETPANKPRRRRGKPRPDRYRPPGYHSRARLAEVVAVEVTELVAPPAPAPRRRKPRPRYYAPCDYCGHNVGVSANFRGVKYCAEHADPRDRPHVETDAEILHKMISAGIHGERTRNNASRTRKRERFDPTESVYE